MGSAIVLRADCSGVYMHTAIRRCMEPDLKSEWLIVFLKKKATRDGMLKIQIIMLLRRDSIHKKTNTGGREGKNKISV